MSKVRRLVLVLLIVVGAVCYPSPGAVRAVDGCVGPGAPAWDDDRLAYAITTPEELAFLDSDTDCLDDSFYLANDIDLSAIPRWDPIGASDLLEWFIGSFNGGSNTITGMQIACADGEIDLTMGLFSMLGPGAEVRDLNVVDAEITGCGETTHSGILAGIAQGLADPGRLEIFNVSVRGEVTDSTVGGGLSDYIGGMIGYLEYGAVENSWADVEVTTSMATDSAKAGGLVGSVYEAEVSNSRANAVLIGGDTVGGLIGYTNLSSITGSSSLGSVAGWSKVGGLVGHSNGTDVSNSFSESSIDATNSGPNNDYVGGLVGLFANFGSVTDSYASGDVSGEKATGGLLGGLLLAGVYDSYALGNVEAVLDTQSSGVGGLIGDSTSGEVERSYALGDVVGVDWAGGFIGRAMVETVISDSFARGAVSGFFPAGFASTVSATSTVVRSFSTGAVADAGMLPAPGGFVGEADPGSVVGSSFWNTETSGRSLSDAGTGKTTSEMRDPETYRAAGWNLGSVWCFKSNLNDGYPVLRTIDFGPGDTDNCRNRRLRSVTRRASFDPNGGTCLFAGVETSSVVHVVFRRSLGLPRGEDCRRPGHVFLGWSRSGETVDQSSLLTDSISRSAALTASWGALPAAPSVLVLLPDLSCAGCGAIIVAWLSIEVPSDASVVVRVDGTERSCPTLVDVFGFRSCRVDGTAFSPGSAVSLAFRNLYGDGPNISRTFGSA